MKPPRTSRRVLSGAELRLWGEIAKLITPLRGKAVPAKPVPSVVPAKPAPPVAATPAPSRQALLALPEVRPKRVASKKLAELAPAVAKPAAPAFRPAPPPPGLERKEKRGLQRGTLEIEARIDLHGLYQAQAHAALVGFITRARAAGHARVLVVTGKGAERGAETAGFGDERGVLRRSVPHWLRGPELRGLVLGFEEAGRRHGGAGALYVRLRRR